ncbi:fungal-specific transcription factor domain-containing protein [Scheffersomyces xylosifermentans]|uniref:fungal-specific transcription factor domain-containing protein n=1 Tax=Scheffersomyces xylosifermentans TaxID=1304137 RepID=UPI00315D474D
MDSTDFSPESIGSPLSSFYYPSLSPFSTASDTASTTTLPSSTESILSMPSPATPPPPPKVKKQKKATKVTKKRKASTTESKTSRSRFGCEECKSKRIKCDETKPRCTRCTSRGIRCNYKITLKFREDLEEQGKKFGREGVWSKDGGAANSSNELVLRSKQSYYQHVRNVNQLRFINTQYRDILKLADRLAPSLQPSIIPVDILHAVSDDASSLNFALTYYINFVSPILNPVGNQSKYYNLQSKKSNKYIVVEKGLDLSSLVQYSQNNNNLFYLILSLGSMYLSKLDGSGTNDWFQKSRYFQELGIQRLKNELNTLFFENGMHSPKLYTTDVLISLVLLILYELANDCNRKWTVYLKMCRKIVNSPEFKLPHNSLEYSLLKFALEFLDYQESIGRTACKDDNSFFLQFQEEEENEDVANGTLAKVEKVNLVSWMGCDRRLLNIISDITDLSFERFSKGITETNYQIICNEMRHKLDKMSLNMMETMLVPDSLDQPRLSTEPSTPAEAELCLVNSEMEVEEFCFLLSCEVKRMATIVYLECCLLNKTPEDEMVQRLVKQMFALLEFIVIKNDFKWYSTLIWSVFIASSEISSLSEDCEELRYLTLQILDILETNTLGSVGRTRQIILDIWKRRDLDNSDDNSYGYLRKTIDDGNPRNDGLLLGFTNDWEKYVVKEDYAISLA